LVSFSWDTNPLFCKSPSLPLRHPRIPRYFDNKAALAPYEPYGHDDHPIWSPDGSKIAFHSDREGRRSIYVIGVDGSNLTGLTTGIGSNDDKYPEWSPDGQYIAFIRTYGFIADGVPGLYVMRADGSGQTHLADGVNINAPPSWSPDSKKILFVYEEIDYMFPYAPRTFYHLSTINVDGSNLDIIGTSRLFDWSTLDWSLE